MRILHLFVFLCLCSEILFSSCTNDNEHQKNAAWQNIQGRDDGVASFSRQPIYRIKALDAWSRMDPIDNISISDTMLPIVEYFIPNTDIHITIHNFPSDEVTTRIPPLAQTARWERQFEEIDPTSIFLKPQSFNGFVGLRFEAIGLIHAKETMIIAWALQLGEEHFHQYIQPTNLKNSSDIQIRSDVTIKISGSPQNLKTHASDIDFFARSFELIDEIPVKL